MKRLLYVSIAVAAMFMMTSAKLSAGNDRGFGITAGYTSSSSNAKLFDVKSASSYHAGIFYRVPLFMGFALQPALLYDVKKSDMHADGSRLNLRVGYLEVPVQIQWGPDLMAFKPYVFAEPFIGLGIHAKGKYSTSDTSEKHNSFEKAGLNRLEYGLGLGVGIKVWRAMLTAKYYWDFGSLSKNGDNHNTLSENVRDAFHGRNFNGFAVSAYFIIK